MTPHEILGVEPNADKDTIKKAYRKLVKEHHPDKNPGDEEAVKKFHDIQNAYDKLTNPQPQQQSPFGNWNPFHNTSNFVRMQMVETVIGLTVLEAFKGCSKTVTLNSSNGERIEIEIDIPEFTISGMSHSVEIPTQEQTIKFILNAIFVVEDDAQYRLDGTTLFMQTKVDLPTLLLGKEIQVETLDGPRFFTIAPGTQTGARFVLNGLGFKNPNTQRRDDLVVTVILELPSFLNEAQRKAIEAFRDASN
jgi:curved DNA-binding protein